LTVGVRELIKKPPGFGETRKKTKKQYGKLRRKNKKNKGGKSFVFLPAAGFLARRIRVRNPDFQKRLLCQSRVRAGNGNQDFLGVRAPLWGPSLGRKKKKPKPGAGDPPKRTFFFPNRRTRFYQEPFFSQKGQPRRENSGRGPISFPPAVFFLRFAHFWPPRPGFFQGSKSGTKKKKLVLPGPWERNLCWNAVKGRGKREGRKTFRQKKTFGPNLSSKTKNRSEGGVWGGGNIGEPIGVKKTPKKRGFLHSVEFFPPPLASRAKKKKKTKIRARACRKGWKGHAESLLPFFTAGPMLTWGEKKSVSRPGMDGKTTIFLPFRFFLFKFVVTPGWILSQKRRGAMGPGNSFCN